MNTIKYFGPARQFYEECQKEFWKSLNAAISEDSSSHKGLIYDDGLKFAHDQESEHLIKKLRGLNGGSE